MESDLQRRIQRYGWDKAANFYETYWQQQLEPAQTLLLKMANLHEGERVLDVACGTGLLSFRAAAIIGNDGSLLGTDISDNMVRTSRTIALEKGIRNVSFERMDAEELQVPDSSFNAVLCGLGLMYFPDPPKALKEMFRALKSGGRAVAAVWGQRSRCGWAEIFPIVDSRVKSEVCPLFFQSGTGTILQQIFLQAGFTNVVSERIDTRLHYDSPEEACGAAFVGGPVALAYSRFNDDMRKEVHAEYLASIEKYKNGSGYDVPGEFVVTCGYRE